MIAVNNVKKRYKDFCLDISMEVKRGCITGLVGKNGAGKSSTFKAILGLMRPESGDIRIFGKELREFGGADKQSIGVSLVESGFSGELTVKDVVPVLRSFYRSFEEKRFLEQCAAFEIPMNKKIKTFSTGMKAKLKVLAAVSHKASLLILDEPTSGLDVMARNELLDILRGYMEEDEGRSILISSHISSDLEGLCDDIYLIDHGKMILHEDICTLLDEYGVLKAGEEEFQKLDKRYLLRYKKESFGYLCLTREKQFYADNYPGIVMEKGNIDEVMLMMIGGLPASAEAGREV